MTRESEIESLLNAARDMGIRCCEGQPATKDNLSRMARHMIAYVHDQCNAGMWRKWAIADARDLAGLGCKVVVDFGALLVGPAAAGQHPLRIVWDFKNTTLRFLETVSS